METPDVEYQTEVTNRPKLIIQIFVPVFFLTLGTLIFFFGGNGFLVYFVTFMCLISGVVYFLSLFDKYKAVRIVRDILRFPLSVVFYFADFGQILLARFIPFVFIACVLGVTFKTIIPRIAHYTFSDQAQMYMIITISVILLYQFNDYFIKWYHKFMSPMEKIRFLYLSNKYSDQAKMRLFIFVVYFFLLIVVTVASLDGINLFKEAKLDIAMLQSFATYVAYDRIVSNWNTIKGVKAEK